MSTLLTFVGKHDPGDEAPKDGPVPSIVRHLVPNAKLDRVFLFYIETYEREDGKEQPGTEREYELTRDRLRGLEHGLDVVGVPFKINPSKEQEILTALKGWINTDLVQGRSVVHVNVASGTRAMSAVWSYLADTRLIAPTKLWDSSNPDMPHEPNNRVSEVGLDYLAQARHVDTAEKLMRAMAFSEAAEALKLAANVHLVTHGRAKRAMLWIKVLKAYADWDRSFYDRALDNLYSAKNQRAYHSLNESTRFILEEQIRTLEAIVSIQHLSDNLLKHSNSLTVLFDLYASLSRRMTAKLYSNVGTRTRRILEGAIRYIVGLDWFSGIESKRNNARRVVDEDVGIRYNARAHVRTYGPIIITDRVSAWGVQPIGLTFDHKRMEELGRIYYRPSSIEGVTIGQLMSNSIEVHGFAAPEFDLAREFIAAAHDCLSYVCFGNFETGITNSAELIFGASIIVRISNEFAAWV